jgi:hypothetical protein
LPFHFATDEACLKSSQPSAPPHIARSVIELIEMPHVSTSGQSLRVLHVFAHDEMTPLRQITLRGRESREKDDGSMTGGQSSKGRAYPIAREHGEL